MFDPKDPKYNHCLKKEIDIMKVALGLVESPPEKKSGLLTDGLAPIGTPVDVFIKFENRKTFPDYAVWNFVDREGNLVSMYGTVKKSPIALDEIEIGDCIEASGKIAKYYKFGNVVGTRISHVKIKMNKAKKKT